ncbi:MAG: rRNA pseudouridine synthase [Clostridia bacterium]|nr:rRNA pseudouridine synthase [Clostridia bacterium]
MESIKLQKYVADCGLMSRRAAEKEIEAGAFTVNGSTATLGMRVDPNNDAVLYKGKSVVKSGERKVYIILNKPKGVVTTMNDEKGRKTVADIVDIGARVYPVGRLDLNSEGLLLMTNDGELTNAITHPSGNIKKVYTVTTRGKIENEELDRLRAVKELDGERISPVGVELISRNETMSKVRFTLSEGKNREIRRICEQVGVYITKLQRISLGPIQLGNLKTGEYRELTGTELKLLKNAISSGRNQKKGR